MKVEDEIILNPKIIKTSILIPLKDSIDIMSQEELIILCKTQRRYINEYRFKMNKMIEEINIYKIFMKNFKSKMQEFIEAI